MDGHESWVGAIVRCGAELVLTADQAGRVIAWDCSSDRPVLRWDIAAHESTIYALAASADGKQFATGDRDGGIRIWQTDDGRRTRELNGLGHPVYGLAFPPDGRQLISADRQPHKPRIKWWDIATGGELRSIDVAELSAYRRVEDIEWGGIRAITISPSGNMLAACGSNGYSGPACVLLFDVATSELKRKLAATFKGFCYSARFHSQGFLLTASGDIGKGEIGCWSTDQVESLASTATPGPCTAIDIHPEGRRFVAAQAIGKGSYPDAGTLTLFEWFE
ncbi:WD40 repeat domain-containing protein [Lignipirellula cremea]|uniref:WD40 repeat domain-containing protein n=1 Tax=Lignipirellula cremea TaxID=2528010 RepID=UPI001E312652|nr:hypothetical protein [Lignipirellula cremea]